MHDPPREVHHARLIVDHDRAARTQHRTGLGHGIEIHRDIGFVRLQQRARAAAGNHRFQLSSAGNSSGDFFDHALQVVAHGQFVNPGPVDVAGDAEQPRAAIFGRAERSVPFPSAMQNRRHGGKRFSVVDDRRRAVEADHGGEGRPDARVAALAFERFHQRGFLAALVGARACVRRQIEREAAAHHILAQIAGLVGLHDRGFDDVEDVAVFTAHVDVAIVRAHRIPGDNHPFDQLVRGHFEQRAILAGAGLAFIGVRQDVLALR